ncbi:MAG: hypothetical protein ABSC76_04365 [Terracidiphilus sp.]|jgi:hypothetical protein
MKCLTNNPAARRFYRRFLGTFVLYALILPLTTLVFVHYHPTGPLAYPLAVLPAIPMLGLLAIFGLYLAEEKDEFQRTVGVQSMLCGIGGTLTVTSVWGFLEDYVHIRHLDPIFTITIFWVFLGLSIPVLLARYK